MPHYQTGDLVVVQFAARVARAVTTPPPVKNQLAIVNPATGRLIWIERWHVRQYLGDDVVLVNLAARVSADHHQVYELDGDIKVYHPDSGNHLLVPMSTVINHIKENRL